MILALNTTRAPEPRKRASKKQKQAEATHCLKEIAEICQRLFNRTDDASYELYTTARRWKFRAADALDQSGGAI
jgi:hypothetical protein